MGSDYLQNTMSVSGINGDYQTIKRPVYTWKCQLHPGTFWMVEDHRVPNWFHRKMQEFCFGIKWMKNDQ